MQSRQKFAGWRRNGSLSLHSHATCGPGVAPRDGPCQVLRRVAHGHANTQHITQARHMSWISGGIACSTSVLITPHRQAAPRPSHARPSRQPRLLHQSATIMRCCGRADSPSAGASRITPHNKNEKTHGAQWLASSDAQGYIGVQGTRERGLGPPLGRPVQASTRRRRTSRQYCKSPAPILQVSHFQVQTAEPRGLAAPLRLNEMVHHTRHSQALAVVV